MTIPTDVNSGVSLYPHEPSTLIPLLQQHQPRSLPVLSSIHENLSIPQPKSIGTGCDVVWATFPHDRLPSNDDEVWAMVIRMQEFERIHLRFYCFAESTTTRREDEDGIQEFVRGVAERVVGLYGIEIMLGGIDSRWNSVMRDVVDARELVECAVFLAPMSSTAGAVAGKEMHGSGDEKVGTEEDRDEEVLAGWGLMVDRARDEDMAIIQSTCDVPRPLEYYRSRSSQSTVIRHKSTGEAVCWIILHADGSIGALYTIPKWRRKGLAEIVVRQNIKSRQTQLFHHQLQGVRRRDFCYVFKGNTASERLWVKMGWEEGWGVRWIVNRKVEEARGKVERFSHPDEK